MKDPGADRISPSPTPFKKPVQSVPRTVVLSVGQDPVLMETRSQVLRGAGYTVVSSLSTGRAMAEFLSGDFDIVILCHTVPAEERKLLADKIRLHSPLTPVVLVSAGFAQSDGIADAILENDPRNLLAGVREIVHKNRVDMRTGGQHK